MVYVTKDLTWNNGMTIPTYPDEDYVYGAGFMTKDAGVLGPSTFIWLDLIPGKYDIVSDVNDNGIYDEGIDALDDFDVNTAGFFVIPEIPFGTILALATCMLALVFYKKRTHTKEIA
jgi:hypothetical protein